MQNFTAHYNIIFNANQILRKKQETYALSFIDNYGQLLNVYQDTIFHSGTLDKDLDAVVVKANLIINEKEQSHYIGDAYVLLGKANYLSGNYFNAVEFFSYAINSFPQKTELVQDAVAWKARALLYLNNLHVAKLTLDTAILNINPKKHIPGDIYAAKLQYDINMQEYAEAEETAKKAIQYADNKTHRLRWTFILGQLQELNHHNKDAMISYTSITRSNADFEMAFNANLNCIRIQDEANGIKVSRIDRLLSLLKNQNNNDFTDQIYYQVAEIYALNNDIDKALKYYKLSVRTSKKNQNQKGLSYLRIADIEFKNKADYVVAKKYYDSTLTNLSPNYRGYQAIQIKSNNLKLLADRLYIIGHEDTLQQLALLDEKTRSTRIDAMVSAQILQQQANASAFAPTQPGASANVRNPAVSLPNGTGFYFYNVNAVSQGYSDFKRQWGNRKLEDDWRRSSKSSTNNVTNTSAATPNNDPDAIPADKRKSRTDIAGGNYRQRIIQDLPLTPQLLAQSNQRVYGAYLDIANFYRDILDDKKEAIATYLLLLNKFPNDPNRASIYYSLYRLYSETDVAKSTEYKNLLLKDYPQTTFAKVILDPDYAKHVDDKDAAFDVAYNQVYDLYSQRKYTQAITGIDDLIKQYPSNKFIAQLYYLKAIASGHQEKLPQFQTDLEQIAANYPDDKLITPLVRQHLAYIETNKTELSAQTFALMNNDTSEVRFIPPVVYKKETAYNRNRIAEAEPVKAPEKKQPINESAKTAEVIANKPPTPAAQPAVVPKKVSSIFSQRDSTNYYFVINVSTGTTDLSSSRFGIGQFNRVNYPPNAIKHQLKNAGADNQLIYVGRFYNLADVKKYATGIIPLLPEIMKVPKDKYSFFIITQENLNKLADKKLLDSYFDYYQQTY
jgi:tetratricopeptide (TPR) repeat protein